MFIDYISKIQDWFIKCLIYFIPVLLTLARYHSFLVHFKKNAVDVIVDEQFCVIPFCLTLEVMVELLRKWQSFSQAIKLLGIAIFIFLFIIAVMMALLYWDLTFISIQKDSGNAAESVGSEDKKRTMKVIIFGSISVFVLSFCVNVLI